MKQKSVFEFGNEYVCTYFFDVDTNASGVDVSRDGEHIGSIIGLDIPEIDDEDSQPLTVGMFKKFQQAGATKTAMQLADEIGDETEKELVKYYLENRIQPSGNPQEDLKDARRMVNAVKNEQIIQEVKRKTPAKTHSNGTGAPALDNEIKGELTAEEKVFLGKPFNLSKEQIIKSRTK